MAVRVGLRRSSIGTKTLSESLALGKRTIRNQPVSETAHHKPARIRNRRIGNQLASETGGAYQKLEFGNWRGSLEAMLGW